MLLLLGTFKALHNFALILLFHVCFNHKVVTTGQPRRHLLTTGWSVFVSSKKLVAGDAFIFLRQAPHFIRLDIIFATYGWTCDIVLLSFRGENEELRVGVRRHMRQQTNIPSSVISSHSMHIGVLATAAHAITTGTIFSVFYKPRSHQMVQNTSVAASDFQLHLETEIFAMLDLFSRSGTDTPAIFLINMHLIPLSYYCLHMLDDNHFAANPG